MRATEAGPPRSVLLSFGNEMNCVRWAHLSMAAPYPAQKTSYVRVRGPRCLSLSECPLLPEYPRAYHYGIGDAGRRGRMAGVWADASPAGPGARRPRAGPAWHVASPHHRAHSGPVCAATNLAGLLCGVLTVFSASACANHARSYFGGADLSGAALKWQHARVQRAGRPGIPAAACTGAGLPQRGSMEFLRLPGLRHRRADGRRPALWLGGEADARLPLC